MKKLILAIGTVIITSGGYAQSDTINKKMFPPDLGKGSGQQTDQYNTQERNTIEKPPIESDNDKRTNTMQDTTSAKKQMMNHPDGYMFMDGKMMVVKKGTMKVLEKDVTLPNGTIIMTNGNYIRKGAAKMKIKDGEHLDMMGKSIPMK